MTTAEVLRHRRAQQAGAALVCAVRDDDQDEVQRILDEADLPALAVILARLVRTDTKMQAIPSIREHAARVAQLLGVPLVELRQPRGYRARHARMVACYIAYKAGWSYPEIGRALSCDHTTAWHAVRRVQTDAGLRMKARFVESGGEAGAA